MRLAKTTFGALQTGVIGGAGNNFLTFDIIDENPIAPAVFTIPQDGLDTTPFIGAMLPVYERIGATGKPRDLIARIQATA